MKQIPRNRGMEINGFQNDRDGWAMIITTRSEETIRASYLKRRAESKKCKAGCAHDEIWSPAVPRDQSQPEKCYRPSQSLYKVSKAQESISIYMSCGRSSIKEKVRELGLGCMKLVLEMTNVLRHLINSTLIHHFPALAQNSS